MRFAKLFRRSKPAPESEGAQETWRYVPPPAPAPPIGGVEAPVEHSQVPMQPAVSSMDPTTDENDWCQLGGRVIGVDHENGRIIFEKR